MRATNAFGQGMSSTTLQLAAAYNSVANDGLYVSPRLVEGEPAGERREVLRPETARTTRAMLQAVIEEGIPHQAGLKGYALAGKTGTAQVAEGAKSCSSLLALAHRTGVEAPIAHHVDAVVAGTMTATEMMDSFIARDTKSEIY